MVNSREKGKRGEREVVNLYMSNGLKARRAQQYRGSKDSADVLAPETNHHIEVKLRQKLSLNKWLDIATKEAGPTKLPLVYFRSNKEDWKVCLWASDFLKMVNK